MNELLTAFVTAMSMRLHRCALALAACVLVACGGGHPDDSTFLDDFGESFRIGPNPAELTIAAGESTTATLVLNCVFNDAAIDISVINGAELARAKLIVDPRQDDRQCDRRTGTNGAGQPLYDGTVSWSIVALDDAAPGRYEVHFLAETLIAGGGPNTERATLIVVVTAEATTNVLPVLSVSVQGRGRVRSEPAGIDCGSQCMRRSATTGEVVTLFAEGNLARWDGCDAVDGNRCTVTMVRTRSVTATFDAGAPPPPPPGSWGLTVTVEQLGVFIGTTDGRLGCQASAGQPRTCVEYFPAGSTVTLYASTLPGGGVLRLESWQRDCTSYGARSEITLTMNRHYHCSAAFVSGP